MSSLRIWASDTATDTATDTAIDTATDTATDTARDTATDTATDTCLKPFIVRVIEEKALYEFVAHMGLFHVTLLCLRCLLTQTTRHATHGRIR